MRQSAVWTVSLESNSTATATSVPPSPQPLTLTRLQLQASADRTISGATPLTRQPLGFHHQFGRERRYDRVRPEPLLSHRARQQRLFCAANPTPTRHTRLRLQAFADRSISGEAEFSPSTLPPQPAATHPVRRPSAGDALLPHQRRRLAGASVLRMDADVAMLKRGPGRVRRSRSRRETQLPDGTCGTSRSASITSASAAGHHRRLRSKDWSHAPRSLGLPHARQPVC
jgi:hypothetical protein